jgi:DNA invertase Pin-like site-specific DNA recombinase
LQQAQTAEERHNTDIFRAGKMCGLRLVAVNDNVDTINGENELAPFLNILNEMHARQTSKKVKAAMRTRFANGAHYGAYAPLGYVKDPDKKGHLPYAPGWDERPADRHRAERNGHPLPPGL